jgi:hypothetical protein
VVTAERVCADCYFLVGLTTKDGERRTYLTWSGDPAPDRPITILDVNVVAGQLVVENTDLVLPARQSFRTCSTWKLQSTHLRITNWHRT